MRDVVLMHKLDTLVWLSHYDRPQNKGRDSYLGDLPKKSDKLSVRLKTRLVKWA
jgi:hypothetical protein